jgi:hypothetical protein
MRVIYQIQRDNLHTKISYNKRMISTNHFPWDIFVYIWNRYIKIERTLKLFQNTYARSSQFIQRLIIFCLYNVVFNFVKNERIS